MAKILKWLTASKAKSYQLKYAVNMVLHNREDIPKEEFGLALQEVLHHYSIRGKFNSIHPDLRAAGVTKVEVGLMGLTFLRDLPTGDFILFSHHKFSR